MNKLILYSSIALFTAFSAGTGLAKDKDRDDKKKKDKDKDRVVYVERDGSRDRHQSNNDRRDDRGRDHDRTRTIYVIERERPVQRVVSIDSDGRYYRWEHGRRVYIRDRYYESYPSKYYHSDGRRRVTITLPF